MSLDVKELYGVANLDYGYAAETLESAPSKGGIFFDKKAVPPLPSPPSQPEKITVSANVQCAFQID